MAQRKIDPSNPSVTRGALMLDAWLTLHAVPVPDFAEKHGINRLALQRAMNGTYAKINVELAVAIERATKGDVPVEAWCRAAAKTKAKRVA